MFFNPGPATPAQQTPWPAQYGPNGLPPPGQQMYPGGNVSGQLPTWPPPQSPYGPGSWYDPSSPNYTGTAGGRNAGGTNPGIFGLAGGAQQQQNQYGVGGVQNYPGGNMSGRLPGWQGPPPPQPLQGMSPVQGTLAGGAYQPPPPPIAQQPPAQQPQSPYGGWFSMLSRGNGAQIGNRTTIGGMTQRSPYGNYGGLAALSLAAQPRVM